MSKATLRTYSISRSTSSEPYEDRKASTANHLGLSLLELSYELEGHNQVVQHDGATRAAREQPLRPPVRVAQRTGEAIHQESLAMLGGVECL